MPLAGNRRQPPASRARRRWADRRRSRAVLIKPTRNRQDVRQAIMSAKAIDFQENYLNISYGVKSWLLTTDHKRIGILYLLSLTFMFFVGGFFAVLMRLELLTPQGDLVQSDTYNKLFTMHGVIMVFFFLIPSIPATLGNFLVPMMVGAKDLAFPKLNLLSWYIFVAGGLFTLYVAL